MPVFQRCEFYVIFLILCFLLAIYNLPIKRIFLRFRYDVYPIMHVWLSISDQLCCRIKLLSFWVHFNTLPTCVIITNHSWLSVFQCTNTDHFPGRIVVHVNYPKTYFIGPYNDVWRYKLLSLLPREWTWNCVYLIWSCSIFSNIFRMKYLLVSNDLSGLIIDRVNDKLLSNSTPFLGGL